MDETSEQKNSTLPQLFLSGWKQFRTIEDSDEATNSTAYQEKVSTCMINLEQCTQMVNMLQLFSSNEEIIEVSTGDIRFFLLPAFLGELTLKRIGDDRKMSLNNANIYFKDYLKRCESYKVSKKELKKYLDTNCGQQNGSTKKPSKGQSREEKIAIYKENKDLLSKIEEIQKRLEQHPEAVDDDLIRQHYLDWLYLWVNKSIENIDFINRELEMLDFMQSRGSDVNPVEPVKDRPVMKPILITREMIQSQVFGAGYRSLPTMTEEEYFQKEVREGKIVLDYDAKPNGEQKEEKLSEDEEEEEDDEKLKKARDWDDWKDTHRRGEGNKDRNG